MLLSFVWKKKSFRLMIKGDNEIYQNIEVLKEKKKFN